LLEERKARVARRQQALTQRGRRPFCVLTMHLWLFKSISVWL